MSVNPETREGLGRAIGHGLVFMNMFLLAYLAMAWQTWQINASLWTDDQRSTVVLVLGMIYFIPSLMKWTLSRRAPE